MADATIAVLVRITVTDTDADEDSVPVVHEIERTVSSVEEHFHRRGLIADSDTRVVWNPTVDTSEQVGSFRLLALWADGDLEIELTTNEGNANEELSSFVLAAGVPFLLGSDASYYDHSPSDVFAGSLDVVDKIRARNDSGADVRYNLVMAE